MHRMKWSQGRRCLLVCLSIGALALGLVLVWWASMNIGVRPRTSIDAYESPMPHATTTAATRAVTMGAVRPSDIPDADEVIYADYPALGETIGSLSIPVLKQTFPIIEGTGDDELKQGVGHFAQSVLPGVKDNCVLSGHRDTVFTGLGKLKVGDQLVTQTQAGTFTYQISRIRIVDKDDKTVIVPADHAVLTVTTCYPFNYVGSAPDRYILVADLVTSQ
ncbi:MAG: class D sortase [Coriobacteriia bacterium]